MVAFKVSAPSRLSLFGEHAVEYGKTGLIATINLRTTLTFEESPDSEHFLITCSQINLSLHFPLEEFLKFYDDCVKYKMELLRERVLQFTDDWYKSDKHKNIVQAFCYLLVHIIYNEKLKIKAFNITFSTKLMVDEEFVCSTSFIVCFTACLVHWSNLQNGSSDSEFMYRDLIKIKEYASRCEEICSEYKLVNVIVCTFGSMIKYSTKPDTSIPDISTLSGIPKLPILLVDSKKNQNLMTQTQHVKHFMNMDSEHVNDILSKIDRESQTAFNVFPKFIEYYNRRYSTYNREQQFLTECNELKECILSNQKLLSNLNLSNHLHYICLMAQKYEMCGKYTDILNGRYAYIWCPQHLDCLEHKKSISEELKKNNFNVIQTNLTPYGVRIELDKD